MDIKAENCNDSGVEIANSSIDNISEQVENSNVIIYQLPRSDKTVNSAESEYIKSEFEENVAPSDIDMEDTNCATNLGGDNEIYDKRSNEDNERTNEDLQEDFTEENEEDEDDLTPKNEIQEKSMSSRDRTPSEGDEDQSIFQAQLQSNCQDVKLVRGNRPNLNVVVKNDRKLIPVSHDLLLAAKMLDKEMDSTYDDTTLSAMSPIPDLDDGFETDNSEPEAGVVTKSRRIISVAHDLLLSASQTQLDDSRNTSRNSPDLLDEIAKWELYMEDEEMEDSLIERLGKAKVEAIPQLTAEEERAEARSWRELTLGDTEHRIDLKVLEPYKRVLTHGGYLSDESHNAIIVMSGCYLPDKSRTDYEYVMNNLFLYVMSTLDQLVTDNYVLIYLHGGTPRSCVPKFRWLKQCYQMIDRRLRKNLKGLYLVHPTFLLKTIVFLTKPFISSKFIKKLFYVSSITELYRRLPVDKTCIPEKVKRFDYDLFRIREVLED